MAHAGTMLGGSAQTKRSGTPWPAMALTAAVVVAAVAGVWLASSTSLVGGTAKPAADRSYDQIEAQRGAITQLGDLSLANDQRLNSILNAAHATPYISPAVTLPDNLSTRRGYAIAAQSGAVTLPSVDENLKFFDRKHATPYITPAVTPPLSATSGTFHPGKPADELSATSGTFHPGKPADQVAAPVKRDRVGGP